MALLRSTLGSRGVLIWKVGVGGPHLQPQGGVLPCNRLMGMCRWMGSHFHDWIDYNGVAFSMGTNRVT